MRNGRNLRKRVFFATAVAAILMATGAGAQTPIPTLPPLPPLPAAAETSTPAAAVTQPPAALLPTAAASVTQPPAAPLPTPAPARLPAERPAAPEAPGGLPSSVVILLGIGVLVLVATLVVVLTVLLKKPVVINVPSRSAAPPPPIPEGPAPAGWTDGGVVHAGQPPAGVLDVLPGRFLVDEGDRQTELRIFRTSPAERVETTIGRDPGPPYRHIQLLPASVSGKHAKLVFDKRSYSLINYARINPTRVNGEEIEENASRRLVDNDRIEIGDVVMTYREN
jgi:hypothetical protein